MAEWPYLDDLKKIRVTKENYGMQYQVTSDKYEPYEDLDFLQMKNPEKWIS